MNATTMSTRTTDGAWTTTSGLLYAIILAAGADAATAEIRASNGGTLYCKVAAAANTTTVVTFAAPVAVGGLFLDNLSGTAPVVAVSYV